MHRLPHLLELLGRIALAWFFVPSGIDKISGYAGTAAYMSTHGVPAWLLPLVIIVEIGAGLALLLGWYTRLAAFVLGGFCLLAVLLFWRQPADAIGQIVQTAELAAAGGLWILAARGSGGWSVDSWRARRRRRRAF